MNSHLGDEDDNAVDADRQVGEQELDGDVELGKDSEHDRKAKLDRHAQACMDDELHRLKTISLKCSGRGA